MMFKGTPTIGTKDYKKDLEIIAAQERVRDEMRQEERKMRAALSPRGNRRPAQAGEQDRRAIASWRRSSTS